MTEQELKDEREQAVKRGGEIYADHYMEGLLDGNNLALRQFDVSGMLLAFTEWQKKYKDSSYVDMFNVEEYLKASNLR